MKVFSSGSWGANVLQGKLNSDGKSCLLFNTVDGVLPTFKRIITNGGKSHVTVDEVKLLACNTPSSVEVFVGQ